MLSQNEIKNILEKVMDMSAADETEARVGSGRSALTRFAENRIHQNVSQEGSHLSVTAILGKQMGGASTSKLDDESIKKAVDNAIEVARFAPPDDELLPRLGPQEYHDVQAYDPAIDDITPMDRAQAVGKAVKQCEENGLKAAGALDNSSGISGYANSAGLLAFHQSAGLEFTMTAQGDDSTGWVGKSSRKRTDVDPDSLGHIAVEKALKGRNPKSIPPGKYTVILEPAAVSIIAFMFGGFNALAVDEGRSFLAGKMGEKVLGDNITLVSDPYHPLHQGRPFDGDGVPTKPITLIENGVAANLVYDRLTAKKHGIEPTGHGSGGRNASGAYPSGIVMNGGNATVEDMIASTDKGILVTRFWYMRVVDPMKVIVTGMTRDGTFLIEDGKIACGIKNFRFNQNVIEMMNNVEMMSEPVLTGMVAPAMKIRDFNFTSSSDAI